MTLAGANNLSYAREPPEGSRVQDAIAIVLIAGAGVFGVVILEVTPVQPVH
jgi:hypothetical protein